MALGVEQPIVRAEQLEVNVIAVNTAIGELLRTLENNEVVDCVGTDCPLLPTCLLRGKLAAAQEAFFAALDPVLIADLIPPKSANGVDANRPEGDGPQGSTQLNIRPV